MRLFVFVTLKAVTDNIAAPSASRTHDTEAVDLGQAGHMFDSPAFFIAPGTDFPRDAHLQRGLGSVGEVRPAPRCTSSGKAAAEMTHL